MRAWVMAGLLLGSCAGASEGKLAGLEWRAADINGVPAVAGEPVTLRLEAGNRVSGNASCNHYTAGYRTASNDRIGFEAITSTKKACGPEAMDQERRYLSILESVQSYDFRGDGSLSLVAGDGRAIRFRRD